MTIDYVMYLISVGFQSLQEYLALHVLMCLLPAFLLAGAIASLFSKESVLKFFGADTPKYISYTVAAVSGCLLAVCSCTALPLFAGIYKRGAGIGPATTFLFSAPAINILAVVYTAKILGYDIGAARAILAVIMSVFIGLTMSLIYERKEAEKSSIKTFGEEEHKHTVELFILLIAVLVAPEFMSSWGWKFTNQIIAWIPLIALTAYLSIKWFSKEELESWMGETWFLIKQITPLLLIGVFFAGIIVEVLPKEIVASLVGGNSIASNFVASIAAALMYFSTLTEVPIIKALTLLGMGTGPSLAMLLAGPALSLPSMIVINRVMGIKKGMTYIFFVIVVATISGYIFGLTIV
ncbi:permease [Methanosarcina mazei]|uniref:Permease n=2 Tax=Methanosarcina mazei TaxID=2209 RepID=A0A0F8NN20_METMZ|nr:permease [Methanosarcina mazei]KKF97949.1 permease [Methanosarcina mazei]KKG06693.1 permease [Methanosarcina mazei]KKG31610.1 permease [Methanosarcina mazei]KKG37866.1 permease [Methanosarcina mazei]KKG55103.1 permease [Methanosarcina mazei]